MYNPFYVNLKKEKIYHACKYILFFLEGPRRNNSGYFWRGRGCDGMKEVELWDFYFSFFIFLNYKDFYFYYIFFILRNKCVISQFGKKFLLYKLVQKLDMTDQSTANYYLSWSSPTRRQFACSKQLKEFTIFRHFKFKSFTGKNLCCILILKFLEKAIFPFNLYRSPVLEKCKVGKLLEHQVKSLFLSWRTNNGI